MRGAVQHLEERLDGANRRVVLVLTDRGEALGFALGDFRLGKHRRAHDVEDERQHVVEILRQARAAQDRCVTRRGDAQRHAPLVQLLGQLTSAVRCVGAAIEHAPGEVRQAGPIGRLVHTARADGGVDRHGRSHERLLDDDHGTAREHGPDRRQSAHHCRRHAWLSGATWGWNQPTVRFAGSRRRRAASDTSAAVTRATRDCSSIEEPRPGDGLEVPELMRDVRDAVGLEHESSAQLTPGAGGLLFGHAALPNAVERLERRRFERREADALHGRHRDGVEERLGRRHEHTGHVRGQRALDEAGVEPGLALWRRAAKARPEIHPLRAGQDRVEDEHRKEVRVGRRRRVPGQLQVGGRAGPLDDHAPLAELRRLDERRARRLRARRNGPERPADSAQHVVGIHVAGDDERGVVRNVVAAVVAVEIVARHRAQVRQPADRRVPIRVGAKGHRRHFLIEQLIGIVLAALELRDDDRALGLAILWLVEPVRHPLGLDEEQLIERVGPRRFEIGRLVDPGVAVPHAAEALDEALHLVAGNVGRALEVHVLDPVRRPGEAGPFVAGAHAIPAPDRHERSRVDRADEHLQAIVEVCLADIEDRRRRAR